MKTRTIFECPNCASNFYGTNTSGGALLRVCSGCAYSWNEDQDWRHFSIVSRFESQDEYLAALSQGETRIRRLVAPIGQRK